MYTKNRNSAGIDEKVTNWANYDDELDKFYCTTFGPFTLFLEICMQIHFVVFALSRQINKQKICKTLWEPVYDIFVLQFRPEKQQFSVALPTPELLRRLLWRAVQGLKRIGQSSRLHSKKNFLGWGVWIFCDWRHKWSSFRVILAHVAWPRAQPLGQSVSLKFSLETKLESESFEPLIDFLAFLVQKLMI